MKNPVHRLGQHFYLYFFFLEVFEKSAWGGGSDAACAEATSFCYYSADLWRAYAFGRVTRPVLIYY